MRYRAHPQVVYAPLDDGTGVLLHLETKFYYTLNETGRFLWEKLQEPQTLDALINAVLNEYEGDEETIRESVRQFLSSLETETLIVVEGKRCR